jgi:hypothetical protein
MAMDTTTNDINNEAERGLILKILAEWNLEWMPFFELGVQMRRRLGYPLQESQVQFHLNYLVQAGYAETKLLRAGRADLELTVVRGTAKAVDLREGRLAPDTGVGA